MAKIEEILSGKKGDIVKKCINLTMETYPSETSELLKGETDRFLNPAGFAIRSEIENVFDEVIGAMDTEKLVVALENVIKIRAVQNFQPSEAISFVYLLKRSIREELTSIGDFGLCRSRTDVRGIAGQKLMEELTELDEKIDRVALMAFDVYMRCREKIHEIKLRETKALHGRR
jgi:hypothetical protein